MGSSAMCREREQPVFVECFTTSKGGRLLDAGGQWRTDLSGETFRYPKVFALVIGAESNV
jgi:hypothetical protein